MRIRWIGILAWAASASLVWAILVPYGFRWTGLVLMGVIGIAVSWSAHWVGIRPDRSIAQLLDDIDGDWRVCHSRLRRPYAQHI
jgi:hypothetical protein